MKVRLALLPMFFLPVLLAACATSSSSFVAHSMGYSSTKGRLTQLSQLGSHEMEQLSDGVAITVAGEGCNVTVDFGDETERDFDVTPGSILVFGRETDYLLEPRLEKP